MRVFKLIRRRSSTCFLLLCACVTLVLMSRFNSSYLSGFVPVSIGEASSFENTMEITRDKLLPETGLPFEEDGAHLLLILSYQRCGSSFFGHIFGIHPDVFYAYEPLDALYSSMYGSGEGWGVPSDITNFSNGTERYLPADEIREVSDVLDDMFNCRISNLPPEILLHRFWSQFPKEHQSLRSFLSCNRVNPAKLSICLRRISELCGGRLDPGREERHHFCRSNLAQVHGKVDPDIKPADNSNNNTVDPMFNEYKSCLEAASKRMSKCATKFQNVCEEAKFRAIKTVRATMSSVEELLKRNRNLRVIHLIRDPRPVMLSRRKFDQSGHGIYSRTVINEAPSTGRYHGPKSKNGVAERREPKIIMDVVKEARLYCSTVARDVRKRKELESKYPGAILEVVYENFVLNPTNYTQRLYDFIGVDMGRKVTQWLHENSEGHGPGKNSSYIASKWQTALNFYEAKHIDNYCKEVYEEVKYDWLL